MTGQLLAILLTFGPAGMMPGVPGSAPDDAAEAPPADLAGVNAYLRIPLFDPELAEVPVARVNDDFITMDELTDALARTHSDASGTGAKKDIAAVVQRIVDLKLLVAEAREMGLADAEDVKKSVAAFKDSELRELLKRKVTENVQADPAQVEWATRMASREWKVRSALFKTEEEAKTLVAAVRGGKPFADEVARAVEEKRATGGKSDSFREKALAAPVAAALQPMLVGEISDPVKVKDGFTVLALEDIQYPLDPVEQAAAETALRKQRHTEELAKLYDDLRTKYAKIDEKLLKSLDYHSEKRFEAFLKDERVLVRIKGEKPITVADFSKDLRKDYYHGLKTAVREKKINNKKQPRLEALIAKRLHDKEARARGLHESAEYRRLVRQHEDSLVFGTFLKRAVVPGVEVLESEVRAHYDANQADYSFPRFYTLDSVAFPTEKLAQAALAKARAGTEFRWLKANLDGQLPGDKRTMKIEGTLVEAGLPKALAAALSGAGTGEYRLYEAAPDEWHVVAVLQEIPPRPQPYLDAREAIARKLYQQELTAAVKEWAGKVREAHEVEIYITRVGE